MADSAITIEKIELQGFRIYLKQQTFNFKHGNNPASLAIFAPNARGKSSLIDAFEYYLSENGTLERLGERASRLTQDPGPWFTQMHRKVGSFHLFIFGSNMLVASLTIIVRFQARFRKPQNELILASACNQ